MEAAPLQIGPYRVIRPLGRGGMGTVYLALDTRLDREVALKLFSGPEATSAAAREQVLAEARAAAAFNHPHIASVHDVLDVNGQVAIVFEYVQGETLADRLQRGRLTPDQAVEIGLQLTDALAAAHHHGIVHRDLKPANIAVTSDGVVKVLDFGVARTMPPEGDADAALTTFAGFVGTLGYAPPEQALGQSVDARADVFAMGVVLFELLSARRPFPGGDAVTVVQAMMSGEPPRVRSLAPEVPPELDGLIARMLARDPAKRPASAQQVRDTLLSLASTERGTAVPVTVRPHRWLAALLVAAAITAALVVSIVWGRPETPVAVPSLVVAVMPLTNVSGDSEKDFVAIGVAENLITRLAALQSITVLSRSVVNDALSRTSDVVAVARELDATYLVDGSVQESGERLRIDLRLVEPDGSVIWAENVQGNFSEVFDLQTRLTSAVAQALSVRLSGADRVSLADQSTSNAAALAAYWQGRTLLERRDITGNAKAALSAFDEAVSLDPNFADAHAGRGEVLWSLYLDSREAELARAALEAGTTALRLDPNRAEVRYTLAVTLAGTGQQNAAIEELQRALVLRPRFEDARIQLGLVLARQGRIEEAIAEFKKVTDARPNYARPFVTTGFALFEAGRYAEAAAAFERVTELQPEHVVAYQQAGAAYHELGDLERALLFYEKAITVRPYAPAYSNIGTIHYSRQEYEQAAQSYQKAISLRPNARETHRNLGDAYGRLGRTSEARRAYLEAARLAEADLAVNPRDARILASLAVYQQKLRSGPEATRRLGQALALAPTDFQVLRRAAQVYALANQPDAAVDALEAALARGLSPEALSGDDEFESLRQLPRFVALVNLYSQ
jgi:tetratricopeptide (TPR) repeat protein/tRNA A-37 threonylcarbamoyl transferase component Bud32